VYVRQGRKTSDEIVGGSEVKQPIDIKYTHNKFKLTTINPRG
jgi:hypothetical protein